MSIAAARGERGTTTIADVVVAKVAGIVAREINGVHALGGSLGRVVGALRERTPGASVNVTRGVPVEVGEKQVAVDVDVDVDVDDGAELDNDRIARVR